MATYKLKRKSFTFYDETDNLKRMKDSDILAQQKRPTSDNSGALRSAAYGGTMGLAIGGLAGTVTGGMAMGKQGAKATSSILSGMGRGLKGGARLGLGMGAVIGIANHMRKNKSQLDENRQYNRRLEYAQRQARRRERADWKTNMTQRDGYSY